MLLSGRQIRLLFILWLATLGSALPLDRHVALWVQAAHPLNKHGWFAWLVRLPGNYLFLLVISGILALCGRRWWRAAVSLVLSGPPVGMAYLLIKWMVGRRRPIIVIAPFTFHPFMKGLTGLYHSVSGLSFPSGDATMAFAAAACLAAALPRWWAAFFFAAAVVAAERVLENAHYVSDVVAGAGLGVACAQLAVALCVRFLDLGQADARGFEIQPLRSPLSDSVEAQVRTSSRQS